MSAVIKVCANNCTAFHSSKNHTDNCEFLFSVVIWLFLVDHVVFVCELT